MADIRVVAIIEAKPGGEAAVRQALSDLVAPTRAESGCVSYELFSSASSPTTFVTVEEWKSQADLDAHMQTPHIGAAMDAGGDSMATAPAIHTLVPVH